MSSVALCIPAYNAAWCLPRLLESAKKQLIPFDEILVYNDYSTDNTSEIAKLYGATVIEGDINCGCSTGKNRLAEIAKSEWLHFHDADDDILPNFTTVAKKWTECISSADIVLLHFQYKDFKTGELLGEPHYNVVELRLNHTLFTIQNKIVNFALLRKKNFLDIGGFDLDKRVLYNEDRAFYTKAAINGLSFDYEPQLTCINYFYEGSMSSGNYLKCAASNLAVSKKIAEATNGKYNRELAKEVYCNATAAATYKGWSIVKESVNFARSISTDGPIHESKSFQVAFKIWGYYAYYIREYFVRIMKPRLR